MASSARPATSIPVIAPRTKRQRQARLQAGAGGLRRAHIGAHRDIHADIACHARKHRACDKADRRHQNAERKGDHKAATTTPTMAMVVYWRLR